MRVSRVLWSSGIGDVVVLPRWRCRSWRGYRDVPKGEWVPIEVGAPVPTKLKYQPLHGSALSYLQGLRPLSDHWAMCAKASDYSVVGLIPHGKHEVPHQSDYSRLKEQDAFIYLTQAVSLGCRDPHRSPYETRRLITDSRLVDILLPLASRRLEAEVA